MWQLLVQFGASDLIRAKVASHCTPHCICTTSTKPTSEWENDVLVFFWKWFWPSRTSEKVAETPRGLQIIFWEQVSASLEVYTHLIPKQNWGSGSKELREIIRWANKSF